MAEWLGIGLEIQWGFPLDADQILLTAWLLSVSTVSEVADCSYKSIDWLQNHSNVLY